MSRIISPHTRIYHLLLLAAVAVNLLFLTGCRSSRHGMIGESTGYLSSKVKLTIPAKQGAVYTIGGTLKMKEDERVQLSLLMPILRSEVGRLEVSPDGIIIVDRMGKRYVQARPGELKELLPRKATYGRLEKILYQAAKPNGKRTLTGAELGIPSLKKAKIELYDFSSSPFNISPTTVSSRYKEVSVEELLEMLMGFAK